MAKGVKTGGRTRGTPNRATAEKAAAVAASGLTPLEYLTTVYRDDSMSRAERIEAAKAAAPYVHPKLASIEHRGGGVGGICLIMVDEDDPRARRASYAAAPDGAPHASPEVQMPPPLVVPSPPPADSPLMLGPEPPQPVDRRPPILNFGENDNPRPAPQFTIED